MPSSAVVRNPEAQQLRLRGNLRWATCGAAGCSGDRAGQRATSIRRYPSSASTSSAATFTWVGHPPCVRLCQNRSLAKHQRHGWKPRRSGTAGWHWEAQCRQCPTRAERFVTSSGVENRWRRDSLASWGAIRDGGGEEVAVAAETSKVARRKLALARRAIAAAPPVHILRRTACRRPCAAARSPEVDRRRRAAWQPVRLRG